jgi:hypothetical protein
LLLMMSSSKPNYQATVAFCCQIVKSAKLLQGMNSGMSLAF